MRGLKKAGIVSHFFAFLLFIFSLHLYAFDLGAAQIEEVEGQVLVIDQAGKSRAAIKGSDLLGEEMMETKADSRAVILFEDHSRLQIGPNTKVKLNDPMTEGNNSVMLFVGRIFARIVPRLSEDPIFSVQTLTCTAGVRGTDFEVASGMDGSELVSVEDGEVMVTSDTEELQVKKGEEAEVSNEGKMKKGKRRLRTEQEWEDWLEQREKFFIEHSDQVINNLSRRVDNSRARIKEQDEKLMELKKELAAQAEAGKFFYFKARNKVKQQIRPYTKTLNNLAQANNKLMAADQILARAEEQIQLNPEAYSQEFQDQVSSAREKLNEMNLQGLYRENRKLLKWHFALLAKAAKKYHLEKELFRNLPAKTKQQILKKYQEQRQD